MPNPLFLIWLACATPASPEASAEDPMTERLAPCPDSPNCVSSKAPADDRVHHIAPLQLHGDPDTAIERLRALIEDEPRTTIVDAEPAYLHATYTTRWLRFTDDLELEVDADAGVVHVRSASRVGYGDMGVNRRRVESLRDAWLATR